LFHKNFLVRKREIGVDSQPYIVAEMACAHDGDLDKAKALVDSAVKAKVDAIQLQLFSVNHQVAPHHNLFELLHQIELSADDWKLIFKHAKKQDLSIFAFTYDIPSMELALKLGIDGIKLSSADISNPDMLKAAARSGLPITLGTGATTLNEIRDAVNFIADEGGDKVILMHGVQNFPTAIEDANIRRLKLLQKVFNMPVGYQDHTDAEIDIHKIIDLLAIGMGACIIEKHISLDRSKKGTDYQAALEPDELILFVNMIRESAISLGTDKDQELSQSDIQYRTFQKKKIVAAEPIPKGKIITREMVIFLRTETTSGLSPIEIEEVIGKKVSKKIDKYGEIIISDINN